MKKSIVFIAVIGMFALYSNCVFGQEPSKVQADTGIGKEVFTIVEVMPDFPGGEKERQKFISRNIQYPSQARENNIQGTVYAAFVVEKDGALSNFRIIKGIGYGCDEEVVRVIKMMPLWKPGTQKGIPVRVQINMPVNFKMK